MRPNLRKIAALLVIPAVISGLLPASPVFASTTIAITSLNTAYFQDFDSLSNDEESNNIPEGWVFIESGTSSNGLYQISPGNLSAPDSYSFGSDGSTDRALGGIQGADLIPIFGASFTNQTGKKIDTLEIGYTGEQWRSGTTGRLDKIVFEFSTDATSLETGTWSEYESLTFFTPDTQKVGAKDGNNPTYRTALESQITGLSIENGESFWIRWRDHDARSNDDGLAVDDFSLTAIGAEEGPSISSVFPADLAVNIGLDAEITFNFSETVTLQDDWLEIVCTQSGGHGYSTTIDGQRIIVHPNVPFAYEESCSLTITAASVSDVDADDPPDGLESDFVSSFYTINAPDSPPAIVSITPQNEEDNVLLDTDINILFNEAVDLNSGWFELNCDQSGSHTVIVNSGPQDFSLNPINNFVYNETCTLTISADHVTDQDTDDPPDAMLMDQSISFTTILPPDAAPFVTSTFPTNNATEVPVDINITIDFNEPVGTRDDWFDLTCSNSGKHEGSIVIENQRILVDPNIDFSYDESCLFTILASGIYDLDTQDPPDQLENNMVIHFSTTRQPDLAPYVVNTTPADNEMNVPSNGIMYISFSEPVKLNFGWIDFTCSKSGNHAVALQGGPVNFAIGILKDLAYAEVCTITLNAGSINDEDNIDPPDQMEVNYSYSFSTQVDPSSLETPTVVFNSNTFPTDGAVVETLINSLSVQFNKEVLHDGSDDAADNAQNYRFFSIGQNRIFDTINCDETIADDVAIPIDQVSYNPVSNIATLSINNGVSLTDDIYRLIVCGEHTIRDLNGTALNDGANSYITFSVEATNPSSTHPASNHPSSGTGGKGSKPLDPKKSALFIPVTGFSPTHVTVIPNQRSDYSQMEGLWLEIPVLQIESQITGIPFENNTWDVTWLDKQTGWLHGSAYPGSFGNSVLTGHVWDAANQPGIFHDLGQLQFGDQVIIHSYGKKYTYEVRSVLIVNPEDVDAMLAHKENSWITLVTCQGYDAEKDRYEKRVLVRAEIVEVE